MACSDSAMVGRPVCVPLCEEFPGPDGKVIATIGVSNFQDRPGDRLTLGGKQLKAATRVLNDGKQCHRAIFY